MTSAIKMFSICNDKYELSIVLLKTTLKCPVGVCVFELESHVSQADLKHSGIARSDLEILTLLHPPPKSHSTWCVSVLGIKFRALCMLDKHFAS